MPELPEVEITRLLVGTVTSGAEIESLLAPGINAVKTFDPPLHVLTGATIEGIRRRGKLFLIDLQGTAHDAPGPAGPGADYTLVVHLMSAGRLQLFDKRASLRDKTSRVLLRREEVETEETLAALGPEAWPDTPEPEALRALLDQPRPLYTVLRDQHVIAGIGRSWVDEILHTAKLSPFKRGNDLSPDDAVVLRDAIRDRLGGAIAHYEEKLALPLPDKLPLPLTVHRHNGEPCPRCGTTIEAIFFEDYVMCYCPVCQTDGKVLKDRRLSRLLK